MQICWWKVYRSLHMFLLAEWLYTDLEIMFEESWRRKHLYFCVYIIRSLASFVWHRTLRLFNFTCFQSSCWVVGLFVFRAVIVLALQCFPSEWKTSWRIVHKTNSCAVRSVLELHLMAIQRCGFSLQYEIYWALDFTLFLASSNTNGCEMVFVLQ